MKTLVVLGHRGWQPSCDSRDYCGLMKHHYKPTSIMECDKYIYIYTHIFTIYIYIHYIYIYNIYTHICLQLNWTLRKGLTPAMMQNMSLLTADPMAVLSQWPTAAWMLLKPMDTRGHVYQARKNMQVLGHPPPAPPPQKKPSSPVLQPNFFFFRLSCRRGHLISLHFHAELENAIDMRCNV